jgi:hypothetical protein
MYDPSRFHRSGLNLAATSNEQSNRSNLITPAQLAAIIASAEQLRENPLFEDTV